MSNSVPTVYLHVVDNVVSKLREVVVNETGDDSVLGELQALWELKMMQCGVIKGPIERNSTPSGSGVPTPVHDLNVPYEGTGEYATPTADMLFTPTPLQTPMQTPLPVEPSQYQYSPAGQGEYGTASDTAADVKSGKMASYGQQPSPWPNQRPLGVDVNVAYEEAREEDGGGISEPQPPMKDFFTVPSGKRKRDELPSLFFPNGYIPQQDGSGDVFLECSLHQKVPTAKNSSNDVHVENLQEALKYQQRKKADASIASMIKMKQVVLTIPQHDGFDDVYDDVVRTEDYNTPSCYDTLPGNDVGSLKPTKGEAIEDDEPPLNEDDDEDDLDDLEQGDEEPSINDLVLAQFEKVNRTKSRWKCILKDGIMRLNDKDVLFTKANGEFDF
ncbi:hypothetical protein L1049_016665 [Liquidambar formosana]|uniref:Uncharacterized protein n=1 Tax=Liquidambar formosana TaxID=63359 RepID=A0AAP0RZK3_LIQFO